MNNTLLDQAIELPEYKNLDLTIGEYSELKKKCEGYNDIDQVKIELDFFRTRVEFKESIGFFYN